MRLFAVVLLVCPACRAWVQWAEDGVALCDTTGDQMRPVLVSDGAGGTIVGWRDNRSGSSDIYAQRVDASANDLWTGNGVHLCTATGTQSSCTIVTDGEGGAVVAWEDYRGGYGDIYAQRVDDSGEALWTANGVALCTATGHQTFPTIATDGAGGAIVVWQDYRSGNYDIYAQRVRADGSVPVEPEVEVLTPNGGETWYVGRTYDITWTATDAQGVDSVSIYYSVDGGATFPYTIATGEPNDFTYTWIIPGAITDSALVRIVAYDPSLKTGEDESDGVFHIELIEPSISEISDVGNDQGGQVRIIWERCLYDAPGDTIDVTGYAIYGREDLHASLCTDSVPPDRKEARGGLAPSPSRWDLVTEVPARGDDEYQTVVPTLCDSTTTGICWSVFFVSAMTPDPLLHFDSEPDSGYSVDNIAPGALLGLAGQYLGASQVWLHWNPAPEVDLSHYAVYRGDVPDFLPDETSLIASVNDTSYIDDCFSLCDDPSPGGSHYYKVSALDVNGNESVSSLLTPEEIMGAPGVGRPYINALLQNEPNPFDSATRISFSIERAGQVRLSVLDVKGRLVRTLVDGVREANRYVETWNGRDESGRPVASGTYLYRLEVPGWRAAKKMTLAR